jgi:hypothetical protein
MGGWVGGWVGVKAVLRIAYSNQKLEKHQLLKCTVVETSFAFQANNIQTIISQNLALPKHLHKMVRL